MSFKWFNYTSKYVDLGPAAEAAAKEAGKTSASVVAAAQYLSEASISVVCYSSNE